jgi:methyl-accepting chemotaxis protein
LKLKTILFGYSAIGVSSLLILGGIGYWAITQLANSTQNLSTASEALRASMQADMMHDALRADAFAVILAAEKSAESELTTIAADIEAHSKILLDNMDAVQQLTASEKVRQTFNTAKPKMDAYIASVKSLSQKAAANLDAGKNQSKRVQTEALSSNLPTVITAFTELEKDMATLGDLIAEQNTATNTAANSTIKTAKNIMITCCILAAALLLSLAFAVIRAINKPLNQALNVAETVASGDLSTEIKTNANNEVGLLLQSLNSMRQSLHGLVSQIKASAEDIGIGAQQISAGNTNLSQRTEEQASSLEETASSMEQMASTVKQNAEYAKQANLLATEASAVAIKGGAVVGQVVNTMADINSSSKKIVDIISVIDSIAFQTNILALNAAVEAARAGEQGRGFAVVAAEVRNLAQRSATAAKEIKQLISDSVEKVADGSKLVTSAGITMDEIVVSVKKVTDIVNEIAAASQEQSAGIDQVNNAITNMDEVTQQNAALVEEAAAAANSLESKAQGLIDATAKFKLTENSFTLKDEQSVDLKQAKSPITNELPKKNNSRLKAPTTKPDEDWEEF